ncbi:TniQ family protein [Streptomyces sp. NPDC046939]|uniref:TniQ family protein n=1 Tax=Streptomyces sp. NPDC046939 TaxID=3155376 RepID=UPI0033C9D06B
MSASAPAPLPCSLDPLPDECLPGFILRLSHRLERSPARLLVLTGLTAAVPRRPGGRPGYTLTMRLPPRIRDAFAHATRLTAAEADALCLASLRPRYPVPDLDAVARGGQQRPDWWVFHAASRYCPQCLAGDGSAIQQAHGGAWKRAWRLPVSFSCTTYTRFLEHSCPRCGHLALHHGGAGTPFLPQSTLIEHPAVCRILLPSPRQRVPCGTRLDQHTARQSPPSRHLLALQHRLDELLQDQGPQTTTSIGQQVAASTYFTDLRVATHLVISTWPHGRPLVQPSGLADTVDDYLTAKGSAVSRTRPQDARVTAALFTAADTILQCDSVAESRDTISQLLEPARRERTGGRTHWMLRFATDDLPPHSPALRAAVLPLVRRYTRHGVRGRRAGNDELGFDTAHVPQHLPSDLAHRHLRPLVPGRRVPLGLHRTAVARLVQSVRGGPLGDAAHYLGLPTATTVKGNRILRVTDTVRALAASDAFEAALNALTRDLAAQPLINYERRRRTLEHWTLSDADWQQLCADALCRASQQPTRWRPQETDLQAASILIWSRATQGEQRLAPQTAVRYNLQRLRTFAHSTAPVYRALRTEIETYADHLAGSVDTGQQADPTLRRV